MTGEPAGNHIGFAQRPYSLAVKALALAAVLVLLKWLVHELGFEFILTMPLLTALMGGVVFTLAIILAGVLADFKESERIVGEAASGIRRLHWDLSVFAQGEELAAMRRDLLSAVEVLNRQLRNGERVRMRDVNAPLRALDEKIERQAIAKGATSAVRTIQVGMGNIVRITERIEVIIETTFMRAGYVYAAVVVAAALAGMAFLRVEPFYQALALFGFASFLLIGLLLLVWDLDNPFDGSVRVSTRQLEKVERFLKERAASTS